MGIHVSPVLNLPPYPIPQGHPSALALSALFLKDEKLRFKEWKWFDEVYTLNLETPDSFLTSSLVFVALKAPRCFVLFLYLLCQGKET